MLTQALVESKLSYGTAVWHRCNAAALKVYTTRYMHGIRLAIDRANGPGNHCSNDQVLVEANVMSAAETIAVARQRYRALIIANPSGGPPTLKMNFDPIQIYFGPRG